MSSAFDFDKSRQDKAAAAAAVASAAAAGEGAGACARCGAASAGGEATGFVELLKECARCRRVKYCSRGCQRQVRRCRGRRSGHGGQEEPPSVDVVPHLPAAPSARRACLLTPPSLRPLPLPPADTYRTQDWRRHKVLCSSFAQQRRPERPGEPTPAAAQPPPPSAPTVLRAVSIPTPPPNAVRGACACCAVLLAAAPSTAATPVKVEWQAPRLPPALELTAALPPSAVEALDVRQYLSESATTEGAVDALVCRACAARLSGGADEAEAWVDRCASWLQAKGLAQVVPEMAGDTLGWMAQRVLALARLEQTPDLSCGPESTAGHRLAKPGLDQPAGEPITFADEAVEPMAFPALLCEGKHGWKAPKVGEEEEVLSELWAYTSMRLYSADPRWRSDPDYVLFSLHRLAAFGAQDAKDALARLPLPAAPGKAVGVEITLREYAPRA